MKRKAARTAQPAPARRMAKKPRGKVVRATNRPAKKRSAKSPHDAIDMMIAANTSALGLTLDPAWQPNIKFNLQLVLRHAALVDEFPLPDDAEPAPVFHA
jgi:hypothetical protein